MEWFENYKIFRFRQNIQSPEKGIIYVKDSMHTFYQEAGCFFTSRYQCREFAIERFLNSLFASFKNLAAVEPGDSAAHAVGPYTLAIDPLRQQTRMSCSDQLLPPKYEINLLVE